MSEPITRAELRSFLAFSRNNPGLSVHYAFDLWCEQHPAESASPPRDHIADAGKMVGVESGPGQPMDIVERLNRTARLYSTILLGVEAAEAAAEITRLREQIARDMERAANAYSAGIEAAAQWHIAEAVEWDEEQGGEAREYAKQHRADAAAIRALADKPAQPKGEQT